MSPMPPHGYNFYRTDSIMSRSSTIDSIEYIVKRITYVVDTPSTTSTVIQLHYYKGEVYEHIPFERFGPFSGGMWGSSAFRLFRVKDYCGLPLWTFDLVPHD